LNRLSGTDTFEAKVTYKLNEESEEVCIEARVEDLGTG